MYLFVQHESALNILNEFKEFPLKLFCKALEPQENF